MGNKRVGRRLRVRLELASPIGQALPDPLAQGARGFAGKRYDEHVFQRAATGDFHQNYGCHGVGLASSRAGLQHGDALRKRRNRVER